MWGRDRRNSQLDFQASSFQLQSTIKPALSLTSSQQLQVDRNEFERNGGSSHLEWSTIYSLRAPDVEFHGDGGPQARLRIVCLSDTHGKHWKMTSQIPNGDILIHAGDFSYKMYVEHTEFVLDDFNAWLGLLPHKHKIVICGNHEVGANHFTKQQIQQRLSNCIYLQDSSATVAGLKIYASPWTNSCNMGFSTSSSNLSSVWARIPRDIDILVTHMPPHNVRDLAYDPRRLDAAPCQVCNQVHRRFGHWGDRSLREKVREIRPKVHIFGHVHNSHGCAEVEGTLFINAAQDLLCQPVFFDCIVPLSYNPG